MESRPQQQRPTQSPREHKRSSPGSQGEEGKMAAEDPRPAVVPKLGAISSSHARGCSVSTR